MTKGRFGVHGGQYIPETLMNAVIELEEAYNFYKNDEQFNKELTALFNDYAGRPSRLYYAKKITADVGGMVEAVRSVKDVPVAVGFGISSPEQAALMAEKADGIIIESAIVKIIEKYGRDAAPPVQEFVESVSRALREL